MEGADIVEVVVTSGHRPARRSRFGRWWSSWRGRGPGLLNDSRLRFSSWWLVVSSFFWQPVTSAVPITATRPRVTSFFISLISFFLLSIPTREKNSRQGEKRARHHIPMRVCQQAATRARSFDGGYRLRATGAPGRPTCYRRRGDHVRGAGRPNPGSLQGASRRRTPDRIPPRDGVPGDPSLAARGRRRASGRQAIHRARQGEGGRLEGHAEALARAGGHPHRAGRADRSARRREAGPGSVGPAGGHRDRRPAGIREDHLDRQARPALEVARALPAPGGGGSFAPRRGLAAEDPRQADRHPRLLSGGRERSRRGRAGRSPGGEADGPGHRPRGHGGAAPHRRGADGAGPGGRGRGLPARDALRRRRDDGPGRGALGGGIRGGPPADGNRLHQDRRRRARRRGALGRDDGARPDQVRRRRREAGRLRAVPPRPDGLADPRAGRRPDA